MAARFLIIEDNRPNLDLMSYLLRSFGYETVEAVDGESALELMEQFAFDMFVCDVQLPGIDGYEMVQRLKSYRKFRDVPIVSVSALAMVGDRDRIMMAGFDGYISKPIVPDTFVDQLESYLPPEKRVAVRPAIAQVSDFQVAPTHAGHRATILVVDDQPTNRQVLQSMLQPSGYLVVDAATGQQACQWMEDHQPDLILADLHLAGEPEFEFIGIVKADSRWRHIPFVFISSTTRRESLRQKGLELGAVRFIFRPIEPQALLAAIESCLNADRV